MWSRNRIEQQDRSILLTNPQADLFEALLRERGRGVSHDKLATAVWGWDRPDGWLVSLRVNMHKLRRALEGLPIEIETVDRKGYCLLENGTVITRD